MNTNRYLLAVSAILITGMAGCESTNPDAKIREAADRVEQNTGRRPDWMAAWDNDSKTWTGQDTLQLEDALRAALRNNRDLRADLETIGQAKADLVQATLFTNPVISFMIMFPDGGGRSMLRGTGLPIQPLQDLWLVPVRTEVARRELQQTVLRVADRAVVIAAEVKRAYARLQYTERVMELIRENIGVVRQSTDILRIRLEADRGTQVEATLSRIRELRLQSDLIATESEHRTLQRELLRLMGLPSAADDWRVVPLHESAFPVDPPLSEEALLTLAAEQRLDFKAAEWTVHAAQERIKLRRREGWPETALGLGFERAPAPSSNNPSLLGRAGNGAYEGALGALSGGMGGGGGMNGGPFSPKMRDVKYTIGPMLELEIPIFDWGQAQTARALYEYRQRLAEYDGLAQQIIQDVRNAQVSLRQAHDQLAFYRDSIIPEVERNLQNARQSFVAGRENITVYLGVQEDLISTRLRVVEFLRDYLVNLAELERRVGGRLTTSVATSQPVATQAANQP